MNRDSHTSHITRIGVDVEVTFLSGGVTVHGSLRAPVGREQRVPAAIILAGSGPTDRNGNSSVPGVDGVAFDTSRWLADQLSAQGYASLRFDKLGTGATGLGPYANDPMSLRDQDFDAVYVREARDALRLLAATRGIDVRRLLIVGHSEGGMIALAVAAHPGTAPAPSGLALVEPQYGRILDIISRQFADQINAYASAADAATLITWMNDGIAEIRSGSAPYPTPGPNPLPDATGITALFRDQIRGIVYGSVRNAFGASEDRIDPVALAAKIRGRGSVLITCGTKDFNTPCVPGGDPGSGVDALARAFRPGVAYLAVIADLHHELRDIGAADPLTVSLATVVDYPFSVRLASELERFLRHRGDRA